MNEQCRKEQGVTRRKEQCQGKSNVEEGAMSRKGQYRERCDDGEGVTKFLLSFLRIKSQMIVTVLQIFR